MGNVLRKAGAGTAAYDEDFYLWSRMQAERLRALKLRPADLDIENIATEIEDLGKRDFRSLQSHCVTAIEHLLKLAWSIRDEPRAGWLATIRRHRDEIHLLLQDSPSLRGKLQDVWQDVFARGFVAAYEAYLMAGELPKESALKSASDLTIDAFLSRDFHPGVWASDVRSDLGLNPFPPMDSAL